MGPPQGEPGRSKVASSKGHLFNFNEDIETGVAHMETLRITDSRPPSLEYDAGREEKRISEYFIPTTSRLRK